VASCIVEKQTTIRFDVGGGLVRWARAGGWGCGGCVDSGWVGFVVGVGGAVVWFVGEGMLWCDVRGRVWVGGVVCGGGVGWVGSGLWGRWVRWVGWWGCCGCGCWWGGMMGLCG